MNIFEWTALMFTLPGVRWTLFVLLTLFIAAVPLAIYRFRMMHSLLEVYIYWSLWFIAVVVNVGVILHGNLIGVAFLVMSIVYVELMRPQQPVKSPESKE